MLREQSKKRFLKYLKDFCHFMRITEYKTDKEG